MLFFHAEELFADNKELCLLFHLLMLETKLIDSLH